MNSKLLFVLVCMASFVLNASAQFSNSGSSGTNTVGDNTGWTTVYAEWNPSSFHWRDGYSSGKSGKGSAGFNGSSLGVTLGVSWAISLASATPIFIEPAVALQYSTKKVGYYNYYDSNINWDHYDIDYYDIGRLHMLSVKVPVNFIYKYDFSSHPVSLMPFAGITLRVNAWGEVFINGNHDDLFDEYEFKRFQIGWQVGLKARMSDKFIVGGSFGTDFNRIHYLVKVHTGTIMLGYSF